ncbi:MAG: bisanhydrobacterioruberin hydratase CruF [Bacteroidota bacterium]
MTSHRAFRIAFWLFAGSIAFSLAGAALLNFAPGPAGVALDQIAVWTGLSLDDLIKLPTWVNMAMLAVLAFTLYLDELGWGKSIAFLLVGSVIGGVAELVGTTTGFPFGPYEYGPYLGAKIAGHVPWLIPPSWYAIAIVSLDLSRRLGWGRWGRIGGVALFMVLWDVALDPAMSYAFPFWTYGVDGVFFGMPLVNWAGWALTSLVIGLAFEMMGGLKAAPDLFVERWAPRFYVLNSAFSIAICFAYRAPLAGLAGLVAILIVVGLLMRAKGRTPAATASQPALA